MAHVSQIRNMKTIINILILIKLFAPQHVCANDGFAALGVGGIKISKTNSIALQNEILDISCTDIQVSYDFVNESDRDEEALIMFPLPPYPANPSESGIIAHGQPSGFTITVNGNPVSFKTDVKARLKGREVTQDIQSTGLTLRQIAVFPFDETLINVNHELQISKRQVEALTQKGLVVDGYPEWEIYVTYIWKQLFPAKSVVHIEHSYHPFIAEGTASGYAGRERLSRELHDLGWKDIYDFCPSKHQLRQLDSLLAKKENLDSYNEIPGAIIEYILTTGNSWKDGIRDFKLRIHTKTKDEIVALCFPSKLNKVTDTLYEAHIKNFKPKKELSIYFGNARKCGSNGYGEAPKIK
jgi:hypothetical protein